MEGRTMMIRKRLPTEQIVTEQASPSDVISHPHFACGVEDYRKGRSPRFDTLQDDFWAYERGRLWAAIAPRHMDFHTFQAEELFAAAMLRDYIL
jgi:hypothetical protein